jgi:GntR family transcriptional regulator
MPLNKQSPIPLYYQLAELIREQILQGEFQPGDQLPAERLLSEQHGISRMTTRQAITYLVRDGVLVARHGLGTFVAEPKLTYDALHLLGFTEEIMRRGGKAVSRLLEQRVVPALPHTAAELRIAPGDAVVKIVRLRLSDATPLLLETIFVPVAICPALQHEDMAQRSLYGVLEQQCGLILKRARQTLEATVANDYERQLFDIALATPMILLEGVTADEQNRPVEYFKAVYRGDRFKFAFESDRSVWKETLPGMPRVNIVLTSEGI